VRDRIGAGLDAIASHKTRLRPEQASEVL